MKSLKMLLMVVSTILSVFVFAQDTAKQKTNTAKKDKQETIYRCQMHPEVTSTKPGNCYKCGAALNLSPKEKMNAEMMKTYGCPMHPDVVGDKAGKCPKCGMELKGTEPVTQSYSCPMHPEVTSDKPGTCAKCGSALSLNLSPKERMRMDAMKTYGCPMHPDVTSDKAGKCPKCGMNLIEKKNDHADHQH